MIIHIKTSFPRISFRVLQFLMYWLTTCFVKGPGYGEGSRAERGGHTKTADVENLVNSKHT